ncbi:hypothetical protein [Actinophytocola xanthii]|uniref:DUF932 domain-containing protein n=1 Tax=Actinophytocola xanthii TaxID=1912961 RepID=A0A1Q8C2F7_9PSEU|nr:hypothetical protein [Actinophytocola xanthii]OLF08557.1 hypothetical protein BU204_34255 [Actinophytocola xanthii]
MTTTESVLTARNASLRDMARLLQHQQANKLDVVVPAHNMRMSGGLLEIDGIGEPAITLDGVTSATGRFTPTGTCDAGIADKLGIPVRYLRRMREHNQVDLLDHNVNTWLATEPNERYLARTLRGHRGAPGIGRALLSEKYKITDNLDVLMSVLAGIKAAGVAVDVTRCDLTETRMYVKITAPEVAAYAPALLRNYTSPFTRARGIDNPVVFAGFIVTNSEVGHGAFKIIPRLEVQVCDNGVTIEKDALKEVHLGARLDDGVVRWSQDTRHAMAELAGKQARDAVREFLNPAYLQAKIAQIEADAGVPVRDVEATLEFVSTELRFTTEEQNTILNHFIDGGDRSSGGVLHAVTSAAQTLDDADQAFDLERHGLAAMRHAAAFQH